MMRRFFQEPSPTPTPLDNDIFSLVIPVARTNLITNPSFETNTTGWLPYFSGSPARTTTQQYHGAYSLQVTPTAALTDGVSYDISLVSGTTYAVSTKFLGVASKSYTLLIQTALAVELIQKTFTATGRWQWIWLYYTETVNAVRTIIVRKNSHTSTAPFYLDGVQVEALASAAETVSTYIDGDQQGLVPNQSPPAYVWNGTPHASSSSRSGLTRAGGQVVRLKDLGFRLLSIVGLTMAGVQNVSTEYARLDGGFDDYTRKPTAQFTLVGQVDGRSYQELRVNRALLASYLDRDLVGVDQKLALLYHLESCGNIASNEGRILCKYQSGFEGNSNSEVSETIPITFTNYLPMVLSDAEQGSSLSVQLSVTNANNIALRSPTGVWSAIGTGANSFVYATTFGLVDEYLYIGGPFSSFNGVANTRAIVRYSLITQTATAMGTGGALTAIVYAIATGPNGHVWAAGAFTSMGGAANSSAFAEWDGSAWSGHTYPGSGGIRCVTVAPNGTVYTGSDTGQVHSWDGSAWTLLGTATGSGADVFGITVGPDGNLYVSGDFTGGLVAGANSAARYTLSSSSPAWQTLSGAPASRIWNALAFAPNGLLYFAGSDTAGTTAYFSSYNGVAWTSLGTFVTTSALFALASTPQGIYFGGQFATFNGVAFPDGIALLLGTTVVPADVNLPGTASVFALARRADGTLAAGYNQSGTAVSAATTTVTNTGTTKSYPTLKITGPSSGTSRIFQVVNYTTGRAIYLNYTIAAGEVAAFNFQPDNLSFSSTFTPNLANTILPGSAESDFFLQPGANVISFYAADSTVTATLQWRPTFASLDGLTR